MENIEIKELSSNLIDDYLEFFDNIAFSDHKEWSWCYCAFYHFDDADIKKLRETGKENLRSEAVDLIKRKSIQGYLAYDKNKVVGWCNCGNKTNYKRLYMCKELWEKEEENVKVKSVVCFIVAPEMRKKGVATKLLERVCLDAKFEGYSYIEAYPNKGGKNCFDHFHGPYKLFEKEGFNFYKEFEYGTIVRKYIDNTA
jgi:GNAT superfamily N-acetyltransferase